MAEGWDVVDRSATFMKGTNSNDRIAKLVIADGSYPSFVGSTPTSHGALFFLKKDANSNLIRTVFGSDPVVEILLASNGTCNFCNVNGIL